MPSGGFNIPIIFLVFKRPALTARVLATIRAMRPQRLIVVADGPRADRPEEAAQCAEVRRLVDAAIDWPCEVTRDYADENLGCARRVSSGITAAFKSVESAVILEDDCLPDLSFFPFCEELLAVYRDDPRVAQVAGCSFHRAPPTDDSYYFSRYPHCWGWATWRRAWAHYDHSMSGWRDPAVRGRVLSRFSDRREGDYWRHAFAGTASGRIDSWAYRWTLSCWAHDALSANAAPNLVSNIGYNADATHTAEPSSIAALPTSSVHLPLRHPPKVVRLAAADDAIGARCFHRPTWWRRVRARLARLKR